MASKERINYIKECIAKNIWNINPEKGDVTTKRGYGGYINNRGYKVHRVVISGKRRTFCIHEIMAIYCGLDIEDKTVDHINNNKLDNRICNLQVLTGQENTSKANKDGLVLPHKGEENGSAKLTWKIVNEIRDMYREGYTQEKLSVLYSVHKKTIWNIVNNKSWVL